MIIYPDTEFVDLTYEKHEECFGFIKTRLDNEEIYLNLVCTKFGVSFTGASNAIKAIRMRGYIWTKGQKFEDKIYIVSARELSHHLLQIGIIK